MAINWNLLIQNDFFHSQVRKISTLEYIVKAQILDKLNKAKIKYLESNLYYLDVVASHPKLYFVIKAKSTIQKAQIQKRIWWLIQKWKLVEKRKEKDFVFKIGNDSDFTANNRFDFVFINYDDLAKINFSEQEKIYPYLLQSKIELWDQPIHNVTNHTDLYGESFGNHDIEIKKGEIKLILETLVKTGLLRKEQDNFYPTSKLRKLRSQKITKTKPPTSDGAKSKTIEKTKKTVTNTKKSFRGNAFIAMQFAKNKSRFEAIKNALIDANIKPIRADDITEPGIITNQIFREIKRSKIIVADVTEHNNGVYYEAGYAHALGKKVIFLYQASGEKDKKQKVHFDIAHYRYISFKDNEDLEKQLIKWLKRIKL